MRLYSRAAVAAAAMYCALAGGSAIGSSARPPAAQPGEPPATATPAPAAPHSANVPHAPGRPSGGSGGGGYNPGGGSHGSAGGGSGYHPGNTGSRPSYGSGSGGGANPGHSGGPHPGQGGGYNPGNGHNASGVWNGHEGEGWNPGNYYRPAVIQGWVRLGSAQAGKGADKDIIQAYGSYRYSVIKLCVRRADVKFHEARVVFARDGQQDLRLNRKVHGGSCTPNLNLRGGRRTDIRYVYLYFRQADDLLNWRTAEVDLYAR